MVKKLIENTIISNINFRDVSAFEEIEIKNCNIESINLEGAFDLKTKLIIENCVISSFNIHSCWFIKGLLLRNNIFKNYIDYQMGGHNKESVILEHNIFHGFFNFFDCQFLEEIVVKQNIFVNGTNLMGNLDEAFKNTFDKLPFLENNIGSMNLDSIGNY